MVPMCRGVRALLAGAICLVPRLAAIAIWPSPAQTNYSRLASDLVEHQGFALSGVGSTYLEPLYPSLLAGFRLMFGDHPLSVLVAQACIGAAGGACFYLLSRRLANDRVAACAVLLYALYPYFLRQTAAYLAFTVITTLLLASAYALVRTETRAEAAICGVWFGLLVLARFSTLVTLIGAAGWLAWRRRTAFAVIIVAVAMAIVAPWIYHDWRTDGGVLPSRLGENLYVSFSRLALQIRPVDDVDLLVPIAYDQAEAAMRDAEVPPEQRQRALDRVLLSKAAHFIVRHPLSATWLIVRDVPALFDPEVLPVEAKSPTSRAVGENGVLHLAGIVRRPFGYELPHITARVFITIAGFVGLLTRRKHVEDEALWLFPATVGLLCVVFFPMTRLIEPVAFVGMFYSGVAMAGRNGLHDEERVENVSVLYQGPRHRIVPLAEQRICMDRGRPAISGGLLDDSEFVEPVGLEDEETAVA